VSRSPDPAGAPNPFSARRVRPGAVPYRFPAGRHAGDLIERLRNNGWRGQIVGPHGSGKSALVAALIPAIEQAGRPAVLIELHDGQRRLPVDLRRMPGLTQGTVVIVDGYEQLGRWRRILLGRFCRRQGLGLVVTTHASVGLPDLFRTTTSLTLARQLVERLLPEGPSPIRPEEVDRHFASHQGNLREVFFDLYDLYETRRLRADARSDAAES
jgi:hypothetical protein